MTRLPAYPLSVGSNIEAYLKPFHDSLTYAQFLWIDDRQIDELLIRGLEAPAKEDPK